MFHLRAIGISVGEDQLYTSTQASIEVLREQMPNVKRLFVLGTPSMSHEKLFKASSLIAGAGLALFSLGVYAVRPGAMQLLWRGVVVYNARFSRRKSAPCVTRWCTVSTWSLLMSSGST